MDLHSVKVPVFLLLFAASSPLVAACSSDSSDTKTPAGGTKAGTGGSSGGSSGSSSVTGAATGSSVGTGGSTSGTTSTSGTGGGTGTGGAGGSSDASPLPFLVDSLFIASGFMGDGSTPGAIVQDDNMTCVATRPSGALGHCHKFTYTPGAIGWGGVYWQYPVNNWGSMPGKKIAPGATKVTFLAAGAAGGETVKFVVGGMKGMTFIDSVDANRIVTLTSTMTPYSVDLTGQMYDAVLGGFGWVIEAPVGSTTPIAFTVDSIRWEE